MTVDCEPSTAGNLLWSALKEAWASASLRCDDTCTRYPPPLAGGDGAACTGLLTMATLVLASTGGAGSACGASDSGAGAPEAFALADIGVRGAAVFAEAAAFGEAGATELTGVAAVSG